MMQQPTYFIVYSVQSCDTQEPTFGRPPGPEFSTSGGESRGAEGDTCNLQPTDFYRELYIAMEKPSNAYINKKLK
jgi:hypothetical protein